MMTSSIVNGWEYKTEITPNSEPVGNSLQNKYLIHYNNAYDKFIKELLIDEEMLLNIKEKSVKIIDKRTNLPKNNYIFKINCSGDNDIINNDDDYPVKFLRSKFFNLKNFKIKKDLINYYKPLHLYVKTPMKFINNNNIEYSIQLFWNN